MLLLELLRSFRNRKCDRVSTHLRTLGVLRRLKIDQRSREDQDRWLQDMLPFFYALVILETSPLITGEKDALGALFARGGEDVLFSYAQARVWSFDRSAVAAIGQWLEVMEAGVWESINDPAPD